MYKRLLKILLTLILLFPIYIFSPAAWCQKSGNISETKDTTPEIILAMIPKKQNQIMKRLLEFAKQYKTSPNSIKKFLLRQKRHNYLKEQLKNFEVSEWIGRIKKLNTTENGKAYLLLELPILPQKNHKFKVTMGTWNNAYTDLDYNTLIIPGTPMHKWLANFNEDEWLVFSGKSFAGKEDFLKEASPNEADAMLSPQFILKFEFIDKIDLPESEFNIDLTSTNAEKNILKEQYHSDKKYQKETKNIKISKSKNSYTDLIPELTIRYYQEYRMSNYDWDYQKYIKRWNNLVRFHWENNPAIDYLDGLNPKGGEIFVLVILGRDGVVRDYQVSSLGEVSDKMREAALEATRAVELPPLPERFPDDVLKIEFRFAHSQIQHFMNLEEDQVKNMLMLQDNKKDAQNSFASKIKSKLLRKKKFRQARASFIEEARQEFSSHFKPIQRFDPNLEIEIEIGVSRSGKIVEQNMTRPSKSVKFQLAVINGLSKADLTPIPKILSSEVPYRFRLKVIP